MNYIYLTLLDEAGCLAHSEWPDSKMSWFKAHQKKSGLIMAAPLLCAPAASKW